MTPPKKWKNSTGEKAETPKETVKTEPKVETKVVTTTVTEKLLKTKTSGTRSA